ncbi:MAG: hypothetical protein ACRCUY_04710, partial [Thermoguttaceae bacterium]
MAARQMYSPNVLAKCVRQIKQPLSTKAGKTRAKHGHKFCAVFSAVCSTVDKSSTFQFPIIRSSSL